MVKVTFQNRDGILGAMVRALAGQVAGARVVGGMSTKYLPVHGSTASPLRTFDSLSHRSCGRKPFRDGPNLHNGENDASKNS